MNFGGDYPAPGHGKVSPRCVPRLPAMAIYRPDAFMKGPRTGKTPVRGNISPACIRIQLILARYAWHVSERPRKAPLGNAPRELLAAKGRFRRSKPSNHARRTNPAILRWPCPLRRGSCPSNRIAGSPFNGLALAQGRPPQRPANTHHLPIPAARCTHCSQRQAADELRWRSSGAWPAARPNPEGPPTASSRRAGRQRNAAQNWAWIPKPRTSGRRTAGGGRRTGRACVNAAKNAHRKDESLLTEL